MALLTTAIVFFGLAACWLVWRSGYHRRWRPTSATWRQFTWAVLLIRFAVSALFVEIREVDQLITLGLSDANKARILVTLIAAAWAALLMLSGRVRIADLLSGPGYWITVLIGLFALSAVWSVWTSFTLYRALELAVYWILVKHIFAQERWREQIAVLCLLSLGFSWLSGIIYGGERTAGAASFLGFRSNGASAVAAVYLVYLFGRVLAPDARGGPLPWLGLGFAGLSLVGFGSLASIAGALAGISVLLVLGTGQGASIGGRFALSAVALIATVGVLMLPSFDIANPIDFVANLFGRNEQNVVSLTGRIPYWEGVWEVMKREHFGLGFAAAERTIALQLQDVLWNAGWATNAHSGFVSAWQSVGWPGLLLLLTIFVVVWRNARRLMQSERALIGGILVLLFVNNFTFNAVGGMLNTTFMIMMALASVPVTPRREAQHANLARSQPLSAAGRRGPSLSP